MNHHNTYRFNTLGQHLDLFLYYLSVKLGQKMCMSTENIF